MRTTIFLELKQLFRCVTFFRLINLIKLKFSYWVSMFLRKTYLWGIPYAISVEPTSHCNLHCVECPSGNGSLSRPHGYMSMELFKGIIDRVSKSSFYLNLYFQGEPMLHPDFNEMVSYAKSKRMFVFTSTNGHFLTGQSALKLVESKLDKLIISMDGYDQESYQLYRVGGRFPLVLKGIRNVAQAKIQLKRNSPLVIAQVLLLKSTENHLSKIKTLAVESGVDRVEFKKAQFYNPNADQALLPSKSEYLRYAFLGEKGWVLKRNKKKGCNRLWSTMVITWEGKVLPCCYDKDADFVFGNVLQKGMEEILNDSTAREFRGDVQKSRSSHDICSNCGE